MLTKLEEQILITVWQFQGEGYGVNIFKHLEDLNEKRIAMGVVYDILERLTRAGYLETRQGKPTPVRGGMKKKFYTITSEGIEEIVKAKTVYDKIMENFQTLYDQYKKNREVIEQNSN
jgi:DNA-binding PadR family transcriptional regulator